jgi:polar amino acid transport system permease protein
MRILARAYVEVFRAIPPLVLILWVYYGLPSIFADLTLSPFQAGVLSLALAESAFMAEIFRSGIQSIERGQGEAADSLGLSSRDRFRYVIFPQAVRRILPALGNQFVLVVKLSSLVSIIGANELTRQANELTSIIYRPLEVYTVLIVEYLVLVLVISYFVGKFEKRMGADQLSAARE